MPILFTIGDFHIFTYSVFLVIAFLLSSFIVFRYGKEDLKEDVYMDVFLYTSFFALVGARIFYILSHFDDFGTNIIRYLVVYETPGLSVWGALFGGVVFLWYYAIRRKIDLKRILDVLSIALCLAFSIISFGSFIGGASFGTATTLPWGVRILDKSGFFHPVELYQSLFFLFLFAVLFTLHSTVYRKQKGIISVCFLVGLSFILFILEFLKSEAVYLYYKISLNHVLAFSVFSVSLGYLIYLLLKQRKGK